MVLIILLLPFCPLTLTQESLLQSILSRNIQGKSGKISQKQNKGSFEFCLSTLSLHTQLTERVVHFYILPFTFPFHSQTLYSLASVWNQLGYSFCQDHQQQQAGDVSVLTWLTISRAPSSIDDSLFWRFFQFLALKDPTSLAASHSLSVPLTVPLHQYSL